MRETTRSLDTERHRKKYEQALLSGFIQHLFTEEKSRGVRPAQLARELEFSEAHICNVLNHGDAAGKALLLAVERRWGLSREELLRRAEAWFENRPKRRARGAS